MRAWAIVAAGLLAACQVALPGGTPQGPAPRAVVLAGALALQAPQGYCVAPRASRTGRGFAMLGACARLNGAGQVPPIDAVITVQAGGAGSAAVTGAEDDLARLLASAPGRALLSGQGNAASVTGLHTQVAPGRVTARFDDSDAAMAGEGPLWRLFFDAQGRLITVSLRGLRPGGLGADEAETLFDRLRGGLAPLPAADGAP